MKRSQEIKIYGPELVEEFRPTLKTLLINFLYYKFLEIKKGKESIYKENAKFQLPQTYDPYLNLKYIALIKNDTVVELIRLDANTAQLLLDSEILTEYDPSLEKVKIGSKYKNNKFITEENKND